MFVTMRSFDQYMRPCRTLELGRLRGHADMASAVMNHLFDPGMAGREVLVDIGSDVYRIQFYRGEIIFRSVYTDAIVTVSRGKGYRLYF